MSSHGHMGLEVSTVELGIEVITSLDGVSLLSEDHEN